MGRGWDTISLTQVERRVVPEIKKGEEPKLLPLLFGWTAV